jgi:putative NADPH-quinone reductase
MAKKVVALIGSYRKDGITDQLVDIVLQSAEAKGAENEKIYLIDKHIEFCTNCRKCGKTDKSYRRGQCVIKDDMNSILDKIDAADAIIFASPINFSTVTAITKKFVERLIAYTYWPAENLIPKNRIKNMDKKSIVITSSTCPAFLGRILMPNALQILKAVSKLIGAKVVKSLYFGLVCRSENKKLTKKQISIARSAGFLL